MKILLVATSAFVAVLLTMEVLTVAVVVVKVVVVVLIDEMTIIVAAGKVVFILPVIFL